MNLYVILRRHGWATSEELQAAARRSVEEGERRSDRVRWIRSYVLAEQPGGLGTACVYEAVSPEAVREHAAAAGLPCDEVIEVADTVVAREDPVGTGSFKSYCVYCAPNPERLRKHATQLGGHVVDDIYEIVGDVTPDDVRL